MKESLMGNDELIPLLNDYLEASATDRDYLKQSLKEVKTTLHETRKCLTSISQQGLSMRKDAEAMAKLCSSRGKGCEKVHDDVEQRLRHIPSAQVTALRDKQVADLAATIASYPKAETMNNLSKKTDRILNILYIIVGVGAAIKWILPLVIPLIRTSKG
jgi:hypothetical protein